MPERAYPARSHPEGRAAGTASDDAPTAVPPCLATLDVTPDGDRTNVTVRGELDLGSRRLLPYLHDVLALSGSGLDLHLDAVGFCDCSGLGMLMDLRTRALGQGRTVTVRSAGTAVGRLLDLTGARELFEAPERQPGPSAELVPPAL
ncbi:STAS domain-containing protein [Streptomyces dubilierae]|uniref:STAS domain-containing protein n=1 Tax=Streptomyces dubilierae TaxID=3075533 RepID=A0ABU2PL40_9ACTN|nr:STAS domain-containing protein [Streptomyces sp. DSM 41921]MDT0392867.1 STAS domain-containing protein [Streptomyces sp. DSM 41921]